VIESTEEEVVLTSLGESTLTELSRFQVESWPGYFSKLTCLDANKLVAYGDSAEIAIINSDGSVRLSHPWRYFPVDDYRISSVRFINGWYYLTGSVTLRTKDFVIYEVVSTPHGRELVTVRRFKNKLLGFLEDAVFTRELESRFLDSLQHDQEWFFAEWLGWFKIIDEDKGDIDHLHLGECWVKQENHQQYWLRTSTLGWIYVYKDWSPWFWRMEDGHWYWLDQDGWPPRAWDDSVKEWVELRP
jgi:hypothetical protein